MQGHDLPLSVKNLGHIIFCGIFFGDMDKYCERYIHQGQFGFINKYEKESYSQIIYL